MASSLFGKSYKTGVALSTRKDDGDGTFWQKIDSVEEQGLEAGGTPRVVLNKTTVHVVREGADSQPVGSQTTEAHFPGQYNYFEKETKLLLKVGLNLTTEQVGMMEGPDGIRDAEGNWRIAPKGTTEKTKLAKGETFERGVGYYLIDEQAITGAVLEMRCVKQAKTKDPNEFFTKVTPIRRVTKAELEETLTPEQISEFFPEGLPEDVA